MLGVVEDFVVGERGRDGGEVDLKNLFLDVCFKGFGLIEEFL